MYYKWYVIGIGAAVIAIIFTVAQCAGRKSYDLIVNYCGAMYYDNESINGWEQALLPYTDDANGNGSVDVFVQQINFSQDSASPEIESAVQEKHDMELSNVWSFIFIYDKAEAEIAFSRESASAVYVDANEWAEGTLDESELLYSSDGKPCGVSLAGSKLLESLGIDASDLYISIRMNYADDETNAAAQSSAVKAANAMLEK